MAEQGLSLPEFAALVALADEGGEVSNVDLKKRYGLTIDGAKRRRLNDSKLVESWKQGRAYVHQLTDDGWARLEEILRTGAYPAMPGSPGVIARGVGGWLRKYMDRSGLRLAEVSMPAETEEPAAGTVQQPDDLEARIRAAYAQLAPAPGSWVSLARLRPLLGGAPRDDVDATLIRMERLPGVNLVPESNQKILTPEDRDAGVIIGDQEKHLLWIGEA
jgi:hypothetical protein